MFARSVAFQLKPGRATEFTKAMEHVIAGTPQVRTYDVANSTFDKIAATYRLRRHVLP
jgi:hypothetical protein